ncbi:MAG: preprotein translocase subunit YajC [Candidatus Ratteibacteria bacterium]|jgi:preprotein translocase subunit YajC
MGQAAQATGGGPSILGPILPLLLIFIIFYFLLIMPQQKKEKHRREMLENIKRGDKVITIGGIVGTVDEIKGKIVAIKIADNTVIEVLKTAVSQMFPDKEKK